jgi:chloramphenicol-sensitive protein RarD
MLAGILSTAAAFTIWGIFPLYLRLFKNIPALEILSHRVIWSILLVLVILAVRKQWSWLSKIVQQPRIGLIFVASAAFLATNWVVYVWAVGEQRIIDASLGYFITPLFNILFGIMLGERLRNAQWLAIAFAASGVMWLTLGVGQFPWIGLTIAVTFSLYGLLRKTAPLGPLEGLAVETLVMLPLAALFLLLPNSGSSDSFTAGDPLLSALLVAAGPITTVPLLLFAFGARRIPMSMLGLLQYIGPSIQLLLGIWLYHEPFGGNRLIGFALIWAGLFVYSVQGLWHSWKPSSRVNLPD